MGGGGGAIHESHENWAIINSNDSTACKQIYKKKFDCLLTVLELDFYFVPVCELVLIRDICVLKVNFLVICKCILCGW